MRQIGVAAYSGTPSPALVEACKRFVAALARRCGDAALILGGYWGLMRCVVDEALSLGLRVVILPPLELEHAEYPEGAVVVRTESGPRLRSVYLVRSSDVLVALGGGAGTAQEIATAHAEGVPVLVLKGHGLPTDRLEACLSPRLDNRVASTIEYVEDPESLAEKACRGL